MEAGQQLSADFFQSNLQQTWEQVYSPGIAHWCPQCGRGFRRLSNLHRHGLVHTGSLDHACPQCPKRFSRLDNLQSHLRNVHQMFQVYQDARKLAATFPGVKHSLSYILNKPVGTQKNK